jgi:hypothetical protein
MAWTRCLVVAAVVSLGVAGTANGQAGKTKPATPYTWEKVARAEKLSNKEIAVLRKRRFVITSEEWKQSFQPYVGSRVPVFITTDSLLNGFHVLFEESVYRMEQAHARKLPLILAAVELNLPTAAKQFPGNPRLVEKAEKRVQRFLGTAWNLLNPQALPKDPTLRTLIQEEVQRITAAQGTHKPAWLGPPDPDFVALDYSRFRPRGFYTKTVALQRYFRAVSWLQAVPFRLDRDEELVAFLLMNRALRKPDGERDWEREKFWSAFREFLGTPDDWDLPSASRLPKDLTSGELATIRKEYQASAQREGAAQINDLLRFPPTSPGGKWEIAFRFLSTYRVPDSVLFQRTMDPKFAQRDLPDGLEVCAALGSPFARTQLARDNAAVLKEIDQLRFWFHEPRFHDYSAQQTGLYGKYLHCLNVLAERTEPDAPAFLKADAWKIKTCQTVLGSWAQMRHTWALQAKQGVKYMCSTSCRAGYVEPVPEFYSRFAKLVEGTESALRQAGAFREPDANESIAEMKEGLRIIAKARKAKEGIAALTAEEKSLLAQFDPRLNDAFESGAEKIDVEKDLADVNSLLQEGLIIGPRDAALIGLMDLQQSIAPKWATLANVCHRLENLAHKQLRQVPFSDEENSFLQEYGKELAYIMLYGGNSYFTPRNDSPRIVDVFANPVKRKYLLVGTARPRTIWVLYPFQGKDVLCRGTVLPYLEFAHSERLTDAEWRHRLTTPQRPAPPVWLQPLLETKASR